MKRIFSIILCIAMILSTMSFVAFGTGTGVYIPAERSIVVTAEPSKVFKDQKVDVFVKIEGEDITNAEWTLCYKTNYFKLESMTPYGSNEAVEMSDTTGEIFGYHINADSSTYENGAVLAKYTFVALPQPQKVTGEFSIKNPAAYTPYESYKPFDAETLAGAPAEVTINLIEYDVTVKFDGEVIEDGESIEDFHYNDAPHTFEVTTGPEAEVVYEYYLNGEKVDEIKGKGEYTVKYTIVNETGYAEKSETFTFNVLAAEFDVEIADYTHEKKLVLVYTNTDNVFFKYGDDLMLDVSDSAYTFNDSGVPHEHVYGYVIDGVDGYTDVDYKENIADIYDGTGLVRVSYSNDVNGQAPIDIRDISTVYGAYNGDTELYGYKSFMDRILRADVEQDKDADFFDADPVITEVYPTTN